MLVARAGRELDDQRPIGERRLQGQEHPAGSAPAQLAEQAELTELFAGIGKLGRFGVHQTVTREQHAERFAKLGKPPVDFGRIDPFAPLLAQAELFVDDHRGQLGLGTDFGMALDPLFGPDRAPVCQTEIISRWMSPANRSASGLAELWLRGSSAAQRVEGVRSAMLPANSAEARHARRRRVWAAARS